MTTEAIDIAASYLVYKLYDATSGRPDVWQVLGNSGERREILTRAVERGWIIVRDDRFGRFKVKSGLLTDEGRVLARKALR